MNIPKKVRFSQGATGVLIEEFMTDLDCSSHRPATMEDFARFPLEYKEFTGEPVSAPEKADKFTYLNSPLVEEKKDGLTDLHKTVAETRAEAKHERETLHTGKRSK